MSTESTLSPATLKVVASVFTREVLKTLSQQEESSVNVMIQRLRNREGEQALTKARLEGILEMVTEHLWHAK
jgi:hypothetical protein